MGNKKIIINTVSGKESGIKTIIRNYLFYFGQHTEKFDFIFYVSSKIYSELKFFEKEGIKIKTIGFWESNVYLRIFWEEFFLSFIGLFSDGIYSITNLYPFLSFKKGGVMIHQSNIFEKGLFHLPESYKKLVKLGMYKANYIVVQTDFMKKNLIKHCNVADDKIKVLPQGISYELTNYNETETNDKIKDLINKLNNENKIKFLYVSLYQPFKNFEKLIKSLPLVNINRNEFSLIITVSEEAYKKYLETIIIENNLTENIINIGVVEPKDLAYIYKNVDIFLFPSLTESLGLPLVEAMSFSLPVIVSDREYAHEVCGENALFFNPLDENDIADKIELLVKEAKIREKYSKLAFEQSKNFSWEYHITKLLDLF